METSRDDLQEARRAMRLAELSPFIDYPRLGRWYPFAWAAWAALFVTTLHLDVDPWLAQLAISATPAVLALAFFAWYARRHGAMPRPGTATPAPLARLARRLWIGTVLLVVPVGALYLLLGPWASIPLAAVSAGAAIGWYEHAYARVAERLRREAEDAA